MRQLRVKGIKKLILFLSLLITYYLLFVTVVYASGVSARATIVMDKASEEILHAKNPDLKLPPASTTKLVTAMVVLDRIKPESIVIISKKSANTQSVSPDLKAGERFTVRSLLELALMRSSNSATVALAEAVAGSERAFVRLMNKRVASINIRNTRFINSSGLPGGGQRTTAHDLAIIMKESLRYPIIREILDTKVKSVFSEGGRRLFLRNTNQLLWKDDDFRGGKTGFTRASRHCFVGATKRGSNTFIVAVLGESKRDNLWKTTTLLLSKGLKGHVKNQRRYIKKRSENIAELKLYRDDQRNKKLKEVWKNRKVKEAV